MKSILFSTVGTFALVLSATSVQAQDTTGTQAQSSDDGAALEDIVVTAQRRAENVQAMPLAITAVGAESLERRQAVNIDNLTALSPGLSIGQASGFSRIYIRGVGAGSISLGQEQSVAFHVDGVVIGRPSAQLASFYDIERIEVLRGPQGTLYGRNATGGAINLITRAPTKEFSGYIDATYGNYDHVQLQGAVSGPLSGDGSLRARVAFQKITHDGYGRNVTLNEDINDQDSWAVRGTVEAEPASGVDVRISADYAHEDDHNYAFAYFGTYNNFPLPAGAATISNSRNIASDVSVVNDREFWGVNGTVGIDIGESLRFQSITGYRSSERFNIFDIDGTSAVQATGIRVSEKAKQFSQELQLVYSSPNLEGVVGLYYFNEDLDAFQQTTFTRLGTILGFPAAQFRPDGSLNVKAYAAFTQWGYRLTDKLKVTAGVRYSYEKRIGEGNFTIFNFLPPPNGANLVIPTGKTGSWGAVTPRLVANYEVSSNAMLYASVTRGFKSGIVIIGSPNAPVNPEYVWSYEAGAKLDLLDRKLRINAAGFYYDYTNLQVNQIINNQAVTRNAASATLKGFELEIEAIPTDLLRLNANIAYLDATFGTYTTQHPTDPAGSPLRNLAGNRLPNAPEWTVNAGGELELPVGLPGRLSVRGDVEYTSRLFFSEYNERVVSQKPVALLDASLRYESNAGWSLTVFGKNLTNELVRTGMTIGAQAVSFMMNGSYKSPRTYGAKLGFKF